MSKNECWCIKYHLDQIECECCERGHREAVKNYAEFLDRELAANEIAMAGVRPQPTPVYNDPLRRRNTTYDYSGDTREFPPAAYRLRSRSGYVRYPATRTSGERTVAERIDRYSRAAGEADISYIDESWTPYDDPD